MAAGRLPAAETEQAARIVAAVADVLGADLLGVYLHGSAVLGGIRPHSDLDVLAVSARRTTPEEKRRLVDPLRAVSGRRAPVPARPVELTIVVASEVRPWRTPARLDLQYGEWLRDDFERGKLEPWSENAHRDVAVLLAIVLLGDRPLAGPPPAELLDPVPRDDLVAAMVGGLDELEGDIEDDTRNVVLTLARIWRTIATGQIRSKDEAAAWVLSRLPERHRPVLERARSIYLGERDERWDDLAPQVRPHAAYVVTEIRRLGEASKPADRAD